MPSKYFPATSAIKASFSCIDTQDRPVVFAGGVTVSDTSDRDNPPPPICGVDLARTPLGNGHIMALQLGGPDFSENIVPQYQQWQQVGRWRQLENDAMVHAGAGNWIFVASLTYGHAGDRWDSLKQEFDKGHTTIFWDDFRIPTVFDVWLLQAGSTEGQEIARDILSATATDRQTAAANLPLKLNTVPKFRSNDDQATEMPREDRDYWRMNELAWTVDSMFEEYREDFEDQTTTAQSMMKDHDIGKEEEREEMTSVLMSPIRETEFEFVHGYGDTIRKQLDFNGWIPSEITQYGTNTHMLQAVLGEKKKLSGKSIKSNIKRTSEHDKRHGGGKMMRQRYRTRDLPYGELSDTIHHGLKGDRFNPGEDEYLVRLQRFVDGMNK